MVDFQEQPRPITVDELRPFFAGHEPVLELALARFHLAVEREKVRALVAERANLEEEERIGALDESADTAKVDTVVDLDKQLPFDAPDAPEG